MKNSNIKITQQVIENLAQDVCLVVDEEQNKKLCHELTVLQVHFDFIRSIKTDGLLSQNFTNDDKKELMFNENDQLKDIFDWKVNNTSHDDNYITIPKKVTTINKHDKN